MKKIALIFGLLPFASFAESDAQIALNETIDIVRTHCSGVSARMEKIKKMAGIGTAVNVIGTAAGAGGVASGVVKYYTDVDMAKNMVEKAGVDALINSLKERELSAENQALLNNVIEIDPDIEKNLSALLDELKAQETLEAKQEILENRSNELQNQINAKQDKSTTLGNVRTGLFVADTATNVAGAIVSSNTVADDDFVEQIKKCTSSIDLLRNARLRVKVEDGDAADIKTMDLSQKILDKCSEYEYVNIQQINNLAKGAMVSNSIGAVTGSAATITSVLGNNKKLSDEIKSGDAKNVVEYNRMNVASNVLGGVTTAASLTGTALNASQIKTAKQILNISSECEEVLKW